MMIRSFVFALCFFFAGLPAAFANDRVELELRGQDVTMSEGATRLMRSISGTPDKPMEPVELSWKEGDALLPDGGTIPISLRLRFVPESSTTLEPNNQLTFLTAVSGQLTVKSKGAPAEWTIEQTNYGAFFAKTHWFFDAAEGTWRLGVHLPLTFVRATDGHRIVGHMFVAFLAADNSLSFHKAWIIPRLGGNPSEAPDKPQALFTSTAPTQAGGRHLLGKPDKLTQPFVLDISTREGLRQDISFTKQGVRDALISPMPVGLTECGERVRGTGLVGSLSGVETAEGAALGTVGFEFTPGPSLQSGVKVTNFLERFGYADSGQQGRKCRALPHCSDESRRPLLSHGLRSCHQESEYENTSGTRTGRKHADRRGRGHDHSLLQWFERAPKLRQGPDNWNCLSGSIVDAVVTTAVGCNRCARDL